MDVPNLSEWTPGQITGIFLTKRDRDNIDRWISLCEPTLIKRARGPQQGEKISITQHESILLEYGFELGFSHQSWFGIDNDGTTWQVSVLGVEQGTKGFGLTVWHTIDWDTGRRTRQSPLTVSQLREKFTKRSL